MSYSPGRQQQQDGAAHQQARLQLTVNPDTGALSTAPLSTVLLAATEGLYMDLYNAAHGEVDVTIAQTTQQGGGAMDLGMDPAADRDAEDGEDGGEGRSAAVPIVRVKKDKMKNLNFPQRRHELAWRLAQHGKALTHVAALTAAAASTDLSNATQVSTRALQHARTAWVQADEAQDALYFFHAQLFPARQPPHDVYGALDVQLLGKWLDMPSDLRLTVDRYETSRESEWSKTEVAERWHMAVRDKLLRGELAWMKRQSIQPLWKLSLRGGIVKLTHGVPKKQQRPTSASTTAATATDKSDNIIIYPIEALVTVLSTAKSSEWTLLSVDVRAQAKTGENNHQLEPSNRQRYDLHRLCALSMAKEEIRARQESEAQGKRSKKKRQQQQQQQQQIVARPLHRLFQVVHTFALSWQLEILSSQAQALKRGNWAAGDNKPIVVTPVEFFENNKNADLGVVSISFWKVDDQYGPPCMGDLSLEENVVTEQQAPNNIKDNKIPVTNKLTLSIRAKTNVGVKVSMSGAKSVMDAMSARPHIRSTIEDLLDATSNPFALSASNALLAATRLCSELKCYAVVHALQPSEGERLLPSWMHLSVERTSIAVAGRVGYHGIDDVVVVEDETTNTQSSSRKRKNKMVVLFRLMCDARTGSFVSIFSRNTWLLRMLACNHIKACESTALQIASSLQNRSTARRTGGTGAGGTGANSAIGRGIVRDAFEGLTRSMNALGERVGVGGAWKDIDNMSAKLRHRAVQSACADTKVSLIKCCGMAAIYGLSALSLGVATGVAATPDMAGDILDQADGISLLPTPPVSVLLDQEQIEVATKTTDGETKTETFIKQSLFALGCAATSDSLIIYPADIVVHLRSPASTPKRILCSFVKLKADVLDHDENCEEYEKMNGDDSINERGEKRRKLDNGTDMPTRESPTGGEKQQEEHSQSPPIITQDLTVEVERFATLLSDVLE